MQRGFSLIEVILFCFGISIIATIIIPHGLEFFQRTTMYIEVQRIHTNLRLTQDLNSTVQAENEFLDFPSIINNSGEIRFRIDSDSHGYFLTEKNYISRKFLQRKFPNWLDLHMSSDQIYFSKFGTLLNPSRTTITLSRNRSVDSGEKYHVILHDNGRIRADFKFSGGN